MLHIACERGEFGRECPGDPGRISEPEIFIRLQPTEAVADQHAPPDLFRGIRSRAMRGGSEEADRRAGLAFGDLGKPEIRLRHARFTVALREDARCAIVRGEGGERPKDIDQIFLTAVSAAPHVVVAVRELAHLARMDLDRLPEVELDAVASRPQYPPDRRYNERIEHPRPPLPPPFHHAAKPLPP